MCCLFGIIDCDNRFSGKQKGKLLHVLSKECEVRGTDATGIAYHSGGSLRIFKRPLPARKLRYRIPNDVRVVMGHTRLATQGDEKENYNNHPFRGMVAGREFALCHNGVLHNDRHLRRDHGLPLTDIETDSYIAVQLLEAQDSLDFESLGFMAEQVSGTFVFTVLDADDSLCFIKGDNPLCLYYFPRCNIYLYASTEEILQRALKRLPYHLGHYRKISLDCGEMLRIHADGKQERDTFQFSGYGAWPYFSAYTSYFGWNYYDNPPTDSEYLAGLKSVAGSFGYLPEDVDALLAEGFTPEEIEDCLYCMGGCT